MIGKKFVLFCFLSLLPVSFLLGGEKNGNALSVADMDRIDLRTRTLWVDNLVDLCFEALYEEDYDKAIDYCSRALAICGRDTMSLIAAKVYNAFGCILARQGNSDFGKISRLFFKSLDIYRRHGKEKDAVMVYSNLGNLYDENRLYGQALSFYSKAYGLLLEQKDPSVRTLCLILMDMAYVNEILENGRIAEQYYLKAREHARLSKDSILQNHIQVNYADFLVSTGKLAEAEALIRATLDDNTNLQVRLRLYELLASILEGRGRYAEACGFYQKRNRLVDSLRKNEKNLSSALLKARMENYRKEQVRMVQQQRLDREKALAKRRSDAILLIGGLSLVFFAFLGFRLFRQNRINKELRRHYAYKEEIYSQRIEKLSDAIRTQDKEMASKLFYLLKARGLQEELLEKMQRLKDKARFRPEEKILVLDMIAILRQLQENKAGWDEFEYYFQQVDPNFLRRLQEKYPWLTPNEKRLCALVSLQLSTKEIALITNKSFDAVRLSKFRLKRRFGLDRDISIYEFLSQFH